MRRQVLLALASSVVLTTLGTIAPSAFAQAQWPSKPIHFVVPATPGGTSDIFIRALSPKLQTALNATIIVDYKPGAATNIGTEFAAKAAPDGYTFLINGITLAVNPILYSSLNFDTAKDLTPVIEVGGINNAVTVHPSIPVNNLKELVEYMKKNPNTFNYGTPGVGSSGNLAGELFALKTGTKFTHVAYQGNAQATTDHIGGTLQIGFVNLPVAMPFVKSGKLKVLAVTSPKRDPSLPDVPTVAEALGIDYELTGWFGIVAPTGTPAPIIARMQREIDIALKDPQVRSIFQTAGAEPAGGTTAEFAAKLKREATRLGEVIRASGQAGKQ